MAAAGGGTVPAGCHVGLALATVPSWLATQQRDPFFLLK